MRMVVFFGLATGTVLETATGKWRGKLTHEVSLFREIDACIEENDVFLADRAYAGWFDMVRLTTRAAHVVSENIANASAVITKFLFWSRFIVRTSFEIGGWKKKSSSSVGRPLQAGTNLDGDSYTRISKNV